MKRIEFRAEGEKVVGNLHLPDCAGLHPGVVVGGPMTSVKEQVTGTYAAALAKLGIAALAIDHRHFGESGGAPRQFEYYPHKIADLQSALDQLALQPEVDRGRLGAVGICLGSGYVAHAINDRTDVKAFVAIAGYYRNVVEMRAADPAGFDAKIEQGRRARHRYEATGAVETIPAVSLEGDAAMTLQSTYDYYTGRAAHPNYVNTFAVMSREHFLAFDVQSAAPKLTPPFLMIHGPNALNPTWAEQFFDAVPGNKERAKIDSKGQTDIYDDPVIIDRVASCTKDFLKRFL